MACGWLRCVVVLGAEALLAGQLLACSGNVRVEGEVQSGGSTSRAGAGGMAGGAASAGDGGAFGGGSGAEQGGEGGSVGRLRLGSWDMTGTVTGTAASDPTCNKLSFTLNVDKVSAYYLMTVGKDGELDAAQAELLGPTYQAFAIHLPTGPDCDVAWIEAHELALLGQDTDADGEADKLSGVVKAELMIIGGDTIDTRPVSITLNGKVDTTAPVLPLPVAPVNPLALPGLSASEPLATKTALTLTGTTTTLLSAYPPGSPLPGTTPNSVIGFYPAKILPLSGSWVVTGTANDLSGLPLTATGKLRTLQDPGVLTQTGFENGEVGGVLEAGVASVVTGVGNQPAITGQRSLWLEPGAALTLHLQRASKETRLRMSVRAFHQEEFPSQNWDIGAGVVGGIQFITAPTAPGVPPMTQPTTDPKWAFASPVRQVELVLIEPGKDVLVRFANPFCGGLCPPEAALLVDDIRLE